MNLPPHSPIQMIATVARMTSSFHTAAYTVLFLEYAKHIPTSRPLHVLFPYLQHCSLYLQELGTSYSFSKPQVNGTL